MPSRMDSERVGARATRIALWLAVCWACVDVLPAWADDTSAPTAPAIAAPADPSAVEVERVEPSREKERSLRFLSENRVFLRAQLDQLRLLARRGRGGEAESLDARYLQFQEMLAAIRAASESAVAARDAVERRELLASVTELAALEAEIDAMEDLLAGQGVRLARLEQDFTGRQETALVLLVRGVPPAGPPQALVLRDEEGESVRVTFSPNEWAALERGGIAQALHAFVEPRVHRVAVTFEGPAWAGHTPIPLTFEPARDRLTLVEIDLAGLGATPEHADLRANVWVK